MRGGCGAGKARELPLDPADLLAPRDDIDMHRTRLGKGCDRRMDLNAHAAWPGREVHGDDLLRHRRGLMLRVEWHLPHRCTVALRNGAAVQKPTSHGEVLLGGVELVEDGIDSWRLARS